MTFPDPQSIAEATRLTRAGDLLAATAAIQRALGRGASSADSAPADHEAPPGVIALPYSGGVPKPPTSTEPGSFIAGSHGSGAAGTRAYKLYVPPAAGTPGAVLPLVVMLHGCTQDADDFAAGTRMNEAAREAGCCVLYPQQSQQANPSRCWNWFKHNHQQRGRGEPALIAAMTREVMQRHAIDPARVWVAGLSAGGAMAAILGSEYPDLYAAVGVHSGLAAGAASDLPSALAAMKSGGGGAATRASSSAAPPPPTIVFHGDADATVHPRNGVQVAAAAVASGPSGSAAQGTPERSRHNGLDCSLSVHRDGEGRVVAEHWLVHGAGHAWSGGDASGSYTDAKGPDATREMLRFFAAHGRRGTAPRRG